MRSSDHSSEYFQYVCLQKTSNSANAASDRSSDDPPRVDTKSETAWSIKKSGRTAEFWTELTMFVRNLVQLLMKQPQAIELRNVIVNETGIVIAQMTIRKLQLGYWPPEVYRGEEESEKSFVYTLGAFLVHIITERPPFHQFDYPRLLYNVGSGILLLAPPADCPPMLASIIVDCCRYNPQNRPTCKELFHRYFGVSDEEPEDKST